MAKNVKSFFDKDSQKPAMFGAMGGLGLYTGISFLAPSLLQGITASISSVFSGLLGASLGIFLGQMIPLVATVIIGALIAIGLSPAMEPETPSKKGLKAGKEFLRKSLAKVIPGGRDTVDAMEDIAEMGLEFAKSR
jgi:hypothetical protein